MDGEYEFVASGDACEVCMGLDGTPCTDLPHENCMCQIVPRQDECEINYQFGGAHRDGLGEYDSSVAGEITVVCADGSEISESFEFDLHPYRGSGESAGDLAIEAFEAEGEALCAQCAPPEPFRCC